MITLSSSIKKVGLLRPTHETNMHLNRLVVIPKMHLEITLVRNVFNELKV